MPLPFFEKSAPFGFANVKKICTPALPAKPFRPSPPNSLFRGGTGR
jgi:hypothetical protein